MRFLPFLKYATFTFVLFAGFQQNGRGQDFIDGINMYNRAQYDSLITYYVPDFIQKNPHEEGLARYFLAECFYNKAFAASTPEAIKKLLQNAWQEFSKANNSSDLKTNFREYFHFSKYKIGWCSFRLAELREQTQVSLQRAFKEFTDLPADAPDSLQTFSKYMAAECRLRENALRLLNLMDYNFQVTEINALIKSNQSLAQLYDSIIAQQPHDSSPYNLRDIQTAAALQKESLKYQMSKLYQGLITESIENYKDDNKQASAALTATFYLHNQKFVEMFAGKSNLHAGFRSAATYFEMMKYLDLYFVNRDDGSRTDFLNAWRKLAHASYHPEKMFRRANLYQSHPDIESDDFNRYAISFYDSSRSLPESFYWLANIQMIQNQNQNSRRNFLNFIEAVEKKRLLTNRLQILLEDAYFSKYLLDFEAYYLSNNYSRLNALARNIAQFSPQSQAIQKRQELLDLLINVSLTNNTAQIWLNVLNGTENEKLEQAISTIMFILPRAALNIGATREKYIILLNRLFEITNIRRSNETRFFRGIVKMFEAEIQAVPNEKSQLFKEAAQILSTISSDFVNKNEADYIRGKCLFFADEFDQARVIFQPLIKQHNYLRALFYLAEIYRLNNKGKIAKRCYEVIIDKLQNFSDHYGEYWLSNANAGLAAANDKGNLRRLEGLEIENVEFKPALDLNQLTYEKLADEKYLQQQYAYENINWLMKFGLPRKAIYPSRNRLRYSIFLAENVVPNLPYLLDEIRGPLSSSLKLVVMLPHNIHSSTVVKLDDEILEQKEGVYVKTSVPLNSIQELEIVNPDCYAHKQPLPFTKAGENQAVVILNKKIQFKPAPPGLKTAAANVRTPLVRRWDGNYIMDAAIPQQLPDSPLLHDFVNRLEIRDMAYDGVGDRILAVNAEDNAIWIYSNAARSERTGKLALNVELNSPEGVDVDSSGLIYVCDWGHHRIHQLDNRGQLLNSFGSFGTNYNKDEGQPIKLSFPTRIQVVEDAVGLIFQGEKVKRETYLFIADQNGVHIANLRGDYLGSPLSANHQLPEGTFYGFFVENYGPDLNLFLVNRNLQKSEAVYKFVAN